MSTSKIQTYRTKEDAFLLIIVRIESKTKNLVFLIDPWKVGLRDYTEHEGSLDEIKTKIGMPNIEFHDISKNDAAKFLKIGYNIATYHDLEIPERAEKWLEKLGVLKLELDGTLYRCFNCETGDLSEDDIAEIVEITREELKKDIIGTDKEEQYFYICDTCEKEMHESHEKSSSKDD